MARDSKTEVAAINVRIPIPERRDYPALVSSLARLRRGVRVYGNSYVTINYFDQDTGIGILSKYTEIDLDGDWFDVDEFDIADPDARGEISIPERLKPNLSQFYFKLDEELHIIAFQSYSQSKSLSARSVEKYFIDSLKQPTIREQFGRVAADIVKSYAEVERLLNLPDLKEVRLIVRRPNPDDIGDSLAEVIEERLREQHGDEYEEVLRAKGKNNLDPNKRTQDLAHVAAENGEVITHSLINGVRTMSSTEQSPLVEKITYKADDSERHVFMQLARSIFERIRGERRRLNE